MENNYPVEKCSELGQKIASYVEEANLEAVNKLVLEIAQISFEAGYISARNVFTEK